jgi:serine protease Do
MGAADGKGVRVTGVREASPADSAGVRAGDVIVEFGGRPVKDLYEFTDVLRAHRPGDTVNVVVEREGRRVTLRATLRSRSG